MRHPRPYSGRFHENPSNMETVSLKGYMRWVEKMLEYYCSVDGKVNAYDRLCKIASPYAEELESRLKK